MILPMPYGMGFLFSPVGITVCGRIAAHILRRLFFMKQSQNRPVMATKTMAYCALLAALSVVLARLIIPMPNASTRFSIEAVPIL